MRRTARRFMSTTARSTATSSESAASSARLTASSSRSKRFMASDIDTATPKRGSRRSPWATLKRLMRPTGVRARLFSETGELLGDSAVLSDVGRIHVIPLPPPEIAPVETEQRLGDQISDWIARQLTRTDRYPEYIERAVPSVRD